MNINQQLYETAYKMLLSMLPQRLTEKDLDKYLQGNRSNPKDLKEVYRAFIRTAQNYQFMPNVIKFDSRENTIAEILHDYDYKYVCTLNPDVLFDDFKSAFVISSEKSWRLWSKAVVDSAKFICSFKSINEFNEFVTKSNDLKAVPLLISRKIRGIGFALACNALKDIGYLDYVKPDVHLIDICEALGITGRDQIEVFDAMQQIAKDNNITPYKLDKVLWLVCSGYFYEDQIRVKGRKEELIDKVKGVQEKKQHILRVRKHSSDSNSDIQTRIETIKKPVVSDGVPKMSDEDIKKMFPIGCIVRHKKFGDGVVKNISDGVITIKFTNESEKELGVDFCIKNKLIEKI